MIHVFWRHADSLERRFLDQISNKFHSHRSELREGDASSVPSHNGVQDVVSFIIVSLNSGVIVDLSLLNIYSCRFRPDLVLLYNIRLLKETKVPKSMGRLSQFQV